MNTLKIIAVLMLAGSCSGLSSAADLEKPPRPIIVVHFDFYPKDRPQLRELEHRLDKAIKRVGVGQLEETELHVDGNDGYLYLQGRDFNRLYAVVRPILLSSKLMSSAEVTRSFPAPESSFPLHQPVRAR